MTSHLDRCVACGKRIRRAKSADGVALPNHHCSRRHETAVEAANCEPDESAPGERSFVERLEEGFDLLGAHFELLAPDDEIELAAN